MEDDKMGLVHGLPDELKISLLMVAMDDAPQTRQANVDALSKQQQMKREKMEVAKKRDLENKGDEYITSLIFHAMWGTAACWATVAAITKGLKELKFKKHKLQALKDNIQMRWKEFGYEDAKTR